VGGPRNHPLPPAGPGPRGRLHTSTRYSRHRRPMDLIPRRFSSCDGDFAASAGPRRRENGSKAKGLGLRGCRVSTRSTLRRANNPIRSTSPSTDGIPWTVFPRGLRNQCFRARTAARRVTQHCEQERGLKKGLRHPRRSTVAVWSTGSRIAVVGEPAISRQCGALVEPRSTGEKLRRLQPTPGASTRAWN